MRLLDLVEEHHLIRTTADGLGQRAAFLVADISGRRADQTRDRVLLHVFRHVDANHRVLVVEQNSASALRSSVLPTPVGPRNMNEPIGRFGSCRPARERRTAFDSVHGFALADDALGELVFHLQQLLALAFEHLVDRDAGPAR